MPTENDLLKTSKQESDSLNGVFQKIFRSEEKPPILEIVNAQSMPTRSLQISNMQDSLAPSKRIGSRVQFQTIYLDTADINNDGIETPDEAETFKKNNKYDIHQEGNNNMGIYTRPGLDPALDDNRFYVRYKDMSLIGKGKIKVAVQINNPCDSKSVYQESHQVILKESPENSGEFISEPFMLVSSVVDDKFMVNGQKDNHKKDQTFLAESGSQIAVAFGKKGSEPLITTAQVPIKAVCDIQPVIYRDKPLAQGGKPLASKEDIDLNIKNANEIYAPAGVKIKPTREAIVRDPPTGVDFSDGLTTEEAALLAQDTNLALSQIGQPASDSHCAQLSMIVVGDKPFVDTPNSPPISTMDGFSLVARYNQPQVANTIIMKTHAQYNTLGHEIGHHLIADMEKRVENVAQTFVPFNVDNTFHLPGYDASGHVQADTHFMRDRPRFLENTIDNTKHLTNDDIKNISQFIGVSPFLRKPDSQEFCPKQKFDFNIVPPKESEKQDENEEKEKKVKSVVKP